MENVKKLLSIWFDPFEYVWASDRKTSKRKAISQEGVLMKYVNGESNDGYYICLHSASQFGSTRETSGMSGIHRNLLVEFDDVDLDQQEQIISSSGLPFSTKVFSGSKSFHYVISLADSISWELYQEYFLRLCSIFPDMDSTNGQSVRYSRLPSGLRLETGKHQTLDYAGARVPNREFESFLFKDNHMKKFQRAKEEKRFIVKPKLASESKSTRNRRNIVYLIDWYVNEYLKVGFQTHNTKVQCPVCEKNKKDKSEDNLSITLPDRVFNCMAGDYSHNKEILPTIRNLKKTIG